MVPVSGIESFDFIGQVPTINLFSLKQNVSKPSINLLNINSYDCLVAVGEHYNQKIGITLPHFVNYCLFQKSPIITISIRFDAIGKTEFLV